MREQRHASAVTPPRYPTNTRDIDGSGSAQSSRATNARVTGHPLYLLFVMPTAWNGHDNITPRIESSRWSSMQITMF